MRVVFLRALCGAFLVLAAAVRATSAADCDTATRQKAEERVILNELAPLARWRGQAVLRVFNQHTKAETYICGATAIAAEWVLTAAHCLEGMANSPNGIVVDDNERLEVVIGVSHLNAVKPEHVFLVEKFIVHNKYWKASEGGDDLALIKLGRPWNGALARLPRDGKADPPSNNGFVMVAGFGAQASAPGKPKLLRF